MCLHETKWVGEKAKELDRSGFKLWYTRKVRSKNRVGAIVDKEWKKDIEEDVNIDYHGFCSMTLIDLCVFVCGFIIISINDDSFKAIPKDWFDINLDSAMINVIVSYIIQGQFASFNDKFFIKTVFVKKFTFQFFFYQIRPCIRGMEADLELHVTCYVTRLVKKKVNFTS
jgi:hypothetical protein